MLLRANMEMVMVTTMMATLLGTRKAPGESSSNLTKLHVGFLGKMGKAKGGIAN